MNKTPNIREIAYTRAHARTIRNRGDAVAKEALRLARRELKRAERDWRDLKLRVLCAASIEDAAEAKREAGGALLRVVASDGVRR